MRYLGMLRGPFYRRPRRWRGKSGATAGEAALSGVNGVGAAKLCAGVNGGVEARCVLVK